jgi:hypothetical protein
MKNRNIILTTILLTLGSFTLAQRTHAVVPAPDGGYPGLNTAEGQNALFFLTTGQGNTAVGYFSLNSTTAGSFNTAMGAGALLDNLADENTAFGAVALLNNTSGGGNTATGASALLDNTIGQNNTANGASALQTNTEGSDNTATGRQALINNRTGGSNTAVGVFALNNNIDGGVNTAIGISALQNNNHGSNNTAIGRNALGGSNGNFNIGLGSNAGVNVTSASNVICIGADGNNVDNACYIGQIFGATSSGGTAVLINSNGRLGTMTSSARFKDEIKPMGAASEAILALKPVTFRYKKEIDPQGIPQCGLVAEDVAAVNPDLVVRDKEGKPYSVRYEQVNAMLLNEFLKAHRKIQEQEATITQLRKEMETVVAHAKEQDSRIQKVSDQIEINKATPGVVRNNLRRPESNSGPQ